MELITEQEREEVKLNFLYHQLSSIEIGWIVLEVTESRLSISTTQEAYLDSLIDFVVGLMSVLPNTPILAFGYNYGFHNRMDEPELNALFERFGARNNWSDILTNPKIGNITTISERSGYDSSGYFNIALQPSNILNSGIFININNHFSFPAEQIFLAKNIMKIIKTYRKKIVDDAVLFAKEILNKN